MRILSCILYFLNPLPWEKRQQEPTDGIIRKFPHRCYKYGYKMKFSDKYMQENLHILNNKRYYNFKSKITQEIVACCILSYHI